MKHFNKEEWNLFYNNRLNDVKLIEQMEEHLGVCDECLNYYLDNFTEDDIKAADSNLSNEIVDEIMQKVSQFERNNTNTIVNTKQLLLYYTAAAAVTIILSFSGFFNSMTVNIERRLNMAEEVQQNVKKTFANNWSNRLTGITITFMDQ